jgi:hypothetical protein
MKTAFALALGMLVMASSAWGDTPIYKWVDAQGGVHYSTVPHSDDAKQLSIVNTGTLPNASTAPGAATAASSPAADASLVMPTQADSPACKAGRDRLFKYLHADHLYVLDDKGQKQQMSKDDQDKALNEARDYVRQACAPGAQ